MPHVLLLLCTRRATGTSGKRSRQQTTIYGMTHASHNPRSAMPIMASLSLCFRLSYSSDSRSSAGTPLSR